MAQIDPPRGWHAAGDGAILFSGAQATGPPSRTLGRPGFPGPGPVMQAMLFHLVQTKSRKYRRRHFSRRSSCTGNEPGTKHEVVVDTCVKPHVSLHTSHKMTTFHEATGSLTRRRGIQSFKICLPSQFGQVVRLYQSIRDGVRSAHLLWIDHSRARHEGLALLAHGLL